MTHGHADRASAKRKVHTSTRAIVLGVCAYHGQFSFYVVALKKQKQPPWPVATAAVAIAMLHIAIAIAIASSSSSCQCESADLRDPGRIRGWRVKGGGCGGGVIQYPDPRTADMAGPLNSGIAVAFWFRFRFRFRFRLVLLPCCARCASFACYVLGTCVCVGCACVFVFWWLWCVVLLYTYITQLKLNATSTLALALDLRS
jgi:hypothetical protein